MPSKRGTLTRGRGQIIHRGQQKYLLRYYVGRGEDGTRRYTSKTVRGSWEEANGELGRLLSELDHGEYVAPCEMSVTEYLRNWCAGKLNITPQTRASYVGMI
jgi:hypothetical protein